MTARVIFLNTLHFPDYDEARELDRIQDEMALYQAEIRRQAHLMQLNEAQFRVYKEASHRNLRYKMTVIRGDKCLT
jgi:hypothetical protein